ncbi:MAG: PfkB family carbohydrate kinase [bacterium]
MTPLELKELLHTITRVHIGIIGDFCLDAYYMLNESASEISVETGLPTRPVKSQRYSLGGAANVASNLLALGVKSLSVFGVIGQDPFGREMRDLLKSQGVNVSGLLAQEKEWDTHVYLKPYEKNRESNRIDFGNFNELHPGTAKVLLQRINDALHTLDIVIINQQVLRGIHSGFFRDELKALIRQNQQKSFIVDSRHYSDEYTGTIRKINIHEALRLIGQKDVPSDWLISGQVREIILHLYERWNKPIFLSRGEHGCVVVDNNGFQEIPGLLMTSPLDPVGAGDSMLAGIAAALAAGAKPITAAELGSLVAGVTVQKLFQTGTATPEEILQLGGDPNYRYKPELARQMHKAVFHLQTEIEIVQPLAHATDFTHFIFDNDGTISTLRQGWEEIMEPMMMKAILGHKEQEADEALYNQVLVSVREYIDKTTGVQTLVQMKGLIHLVRQFHCVPEAEILNEAGYKELYNIELIKMVNARIAKLLAGELDIEDFTVKKAIPFLQALHQKGAHLYLASGTDQEDVIREAETLGYRHLFGNRIFGAVGDVTQEAKKIVLERILNDIGHDSSKRVVTFGDGPVEIRETHKRGGFSIGVASNEIRRYGINSVKRRRLIEAGADLIIPDYSQMNHLLSLLFSNKEAS